MASAPTGERTHYQVVVTDLRRQLRLGRPRRMFKPHGAHATRRLPGEERVNRGAIVGGITGADLRRLRESTCADDQRETQSHRLRSAPGLS